MSCQLSATIGGLTGDCSNTQSGAFTIDILNGAPNYTVNWIYPPFGSFPVTGDFTVTNLSAGTYSFTITDSCVPDNETVTVNVNISSGTCVSLTGVQNTSCGLNNGGLTATTTNFYGTGKFYLYETTEGYITSASTINNFCTFDNLDDGIYYVIADDGGGCTGKTETCIILDSNEISVDLFVVKASSCSPNTGAIYVTGVTGTPPFSYSWNTTPVQTTTSITGLTPGNYILTVTDSTGCVTSKGTVLTTDPPLGLLDISFTNPTCFSSDGTVTITASGGTAPFQYVGSNGYIDTTFNATNTFFNVPAGPFTIIVKDAGNCSFTATTTLLTPGGLGVTSVNVTNSTCSGNGGQISVNIFGGSPPYVYTLTNSLGQNTVVNGNFTNWSFNGLSSDTYTLTISDEGPCDFVNTYVVDNNELFELTIETTGTTCGQEDGSVLLSITPGGTPPFHYEIDGYSDFSNNLTFLYENLSSGNYVATVTDANFCQQQLPFTISDSGNVDFLLIGTDSLNGDNGTISALITDGTPPFVLTWSSNVGGQTGTEVNNLSAGTYTLTVVDDNGCSKTRTITLNGFNKLTSYEVYNICDEDFFNTGQTGRKGPQEMLIEGFHDLTIGDTNCILNKAIFTVVTTVNNVVKTQSFYTGTTLTDFPSDNEFYDVVEELLLTYGVIGEVLIDAVKNTLTVNSGCDVTIETLDATVKVELDISYDISCETCDDFCNCFEVSGPKGCVVSYTNCDGNRSSIALSGTENERICGREILGSECEECTTPLDYLFKIATTLYKLNLPPAGLMGAEAEESETFSDIINLILVRGLVITNASERICCSECGIDDFTNFYMLSDIKIAQNLYVENYGQPNCCNNYSGNTTVYNEFVEAMEITFGDAPEQCESNFINCLENLKNLVGVVFFDTLMFSGIVENPLNTTQTLLCSLVNQLEILVDEYGLTQSDCYDIVYTLLSKGFFSMCKNDTVFIGGSDNFYTFYERVESLVLPSAECPGVIIEEIGQCISEVCPTSTACTSPMEYLFSIIPLPEEGMFGAEITESAEVYIEQMLAILKDGIILDIEQETFSFCCPDGCVFPSESGSFGINYYFLGTLRAFDTLVESKEGIGFPQCCINHFFGIEEYVSYINDFNIGNINLPIACCNSFEPCSENLIDKYFLGRGAIEVSKINGYSELCNLITSVDTLPFNDLEKSEIINSLFNTGFNVWCFGNQILISNTTKFLELING